MRWCGRRRRCGDRVARNGVGARAFATGAVSKEGISGGGEDNKKNRWRVEKLEAARETWALLGAFACAHQDDPLIRWQTPLPWNRSTGGDSAAGVDGGLQEREGAGSGRGKTAREGRSGAGSISDSAIWVWRVPSHSGSSGCGGESGAVAGTSGERNVY